MPAILGNRNKFYVRIGDATSYTWLTGEQSNSVNRTQEAIEVSDKSTDWAQFIGGKKGATIEVTIFADNSDPAQVEILKGLYNGTTVKFFVGQLTSGTPPTPSDGEVGEAIVTSIGDTNDFGAVAGRNCSLTVTGPLTHYPALTASATPAANDDTE